MGRMLVKLGSGVFWVCVTFVFNVIYLIVSWHSIFNNTYLCNSWLAKFLKTQQSALASLWESPWGGVALPWFGVEAAEAWSPKALTSNLIAHWLSLFKPDYFTMRTLSSWGGRSFTSCMKWVWSDLLRETEASNPRHASRSACHITVPAGVRAAASSPLVLFLLSSENLAVAGKGFRKPKARFCLVFMFVFAFGLFCFLAAQRPMFSNSRSEHRPLPPPAPPARRYVHQTQN